MKQLLEYILKSLPLIAVVILSYMLFASTDSQISEGMKLSLSALLGAIASYIFIQYSEFLKKIDTAKAKHQRALNLLEVKLNNQLNWVSDIEFNLQNHCILIEKAITRQVELAYDASSYSEPISIAAEILDVNNLDYKNQLLSLNIGYEKINSDITSMHTGYKFMLDQAISNPEHRESYVKGLPHHLANVKMLIKFTERSSEKTKDALAACRILSRDTKNLLSKISRYFIIHSNPNKFLDQINSEKKILENEIESTITNAQKEINEIEKQLNK